MRRFCRIKAYLRRWGYVCGTLRLFRVPAPYNGIFVGVGLAYGYEAWNGDVGWHAGLMVGWGFWSLISLWWDEVEKEHKRERLAQLD